MFELETGKPVVNTQVEQPENIITGYDSSVVYTQPCLRKLDIHLKALLMDIQDALLLQNTDAMLAKYLECKHLSFIDWLGLEVENGLNIVFQHILEQYKLSQCPLNMTWSEAYELAVRIAIRHGWNHQKALEDVGWLPVGVLGTGVLFVHYIPSVTLQFDSEHICQLVTQEEYYTYRKLLMEYKPVVQDDYLNEDVSLKQWFGVQKADWQGILNLSEEQYGIVLEHMFSDEQFLNITSAIKSLPAWCENSQIAPIVQTDHMLLLGVTEKVTTDVLLRARNHFSQYQIKLSYIAPALFNRLISKYKNRNQISKDYTSIYTPDEIPRLNISGVESVIIQGESSGTDANNDDDWVIKYVNGIILLGLRGRASDIHIEPMDQVMRIRLRVDGILQDNLDPVSLNNGKHIVRRIKTMARMDISKEMVPLDGRIKVTYGKGASVDLRVSTTPVECFYADTKAERCTIRLLDNANTPFDLSGIISNKIQLQEVVKCVTRPHGLVIVSGPTGSGKSTTLYGLLRHLNSPDLNILSAENPVERKILGVSQVQVEHPLSFTTVLRNFLRSDPDVIFIGEVRDAETAELTVRAAQTGHLVFTTLHSNTALSSISRLKQLGVNHYDISSSLELLISQRLVRALCQCKLRLGLTLKEKHELNRLGIKTALTAKGITYRSNGCPHCSQQGYSGRFGVFEVLHVTDALRAVIEDPRGTSSSLIKVSKETGYKNMYFHGMHYLAEGMTDFTEIQRTTMDTYY